MSDTLEASRLQYELDLFREQWKAEIHQRPSKRIALVSGGSSEASDSEPPRTLNLMSLYSLLIISKRTSQNL